MEAGESTGTLLPGPHRHVYAHASGIREQRGIKSSGHTGNPLRSLGKCDQIKWPKKAARPCSWQAGQTPVGACWLWSRISSLPLVTLEDTKTPRQGGCKRVSGDRLCDQGMQSTFMSMHSPIFRSLWGRSNRHSAPGLRVSPCRRTHYAICPVYLCSRWGPFCCCARLGLKIHLSLFKSICIHIQSVCNTSRDLPLLNKFTDLPLTFILVIYIKSFSRRIEALLYTIGCMNGFSRKLKSIVLSDSISVRCSTISRVREPCWMGRYGASEPTWA